MTCHRPHCTKPVSKPRQELGARFCSQRCAKKHHAARAPSRRRRLQQSPFRKFEQAIDPATHLRVGEDEHAQQQAQTLIEKAGFASYVNARGLVRDIGVPVRPQDHGRAFRNTRAKVAA